jgi:hypothetical protein
MACEKKSILFPEEEDAMEIVTAHGLSLNNDRS